MEILRKTKGIYILEPLLNDGKFLSSPIWNINIHAFLLTEIFIILKDEI